MVDQDSHYFVLFGASNLSFALPLVLADLCGRNEEAQRIYLAHGPGRSYGMYAGMPGCQYPGIRHSKLFDELQVPEGASLNIFITDVGNDLAYMVEPEQLCTWLDEILENLPDNHHRIALTALPVASLTQMPDWKFQLIKKICFPSNRKSVREMKETVQVSNANLKTFCRERGIHFLETDSRNYGLDGFHIKWRRRRRVFSDWLNQWLGEEAPAKQVNKISSWQVWRHPIRDYRLLGKAKSNEANQLKLSNNTIYYAY